MSLFADENPLVTIEVYTPKPLGVCDDQLVSNLHVLDLRADDSRLNDPPSLTGIVIDQDDAGTGTEDVSLLVHVCVFPDDGIADDPFYFVTFQWKRVCSGSGAKDMSL